METRKLHHRTHIIYLECQTCIGRGYLRTTQINDAPKRSHRHRPQMTTIPTSFTKHGFTHTLKHREGEWCIFERIKGGVTHYEVIRPVIADTEYKDGVWQKCGPREVYPCSESWGVNGFTKLTYQDALDKVSALHGFA